MHSLNNLNPTNLLNTRLFASHNYNACKLSVFPSWLFSIDSCVGRVGRRKGRPAANTVIADLIRNPEGRTGGCHYQHPSPSFSRLYRHSRVGGNLQGGGVRRLSESGFSGLWGIFRIGTMRCIVLWIPAYAGMTVWGAWSDGCPASHLWIADQVRNDVTMRCIVFTLTFDSSPIKGERERICMFSDILGGRLGEGRLLVLSVCCGLR